MIIADLGLGENFCRPWLINVFNLNIAEQLICGPNFSQNNMFLNFMKHQFVCLFLITHKSESSSHLSGLVRITDSEGLGTSCEPLRPLRQGPGWVSPALCHPRVRFNRKGLALVQRALSWGSAREGIWWPRAQRPLALQVCLLRAAFSSGDWVR